MRAIVLSGLRRTPPGPLSEGEACLTQEMKLIGQI